VIELLEWAQKVESAYWKVQYPFLLVDGARRAAGLQGDSEMVYGNTPPAAVVKLLELAEVRADDVFYDLGCGFGVPTVVAARACRKSLGIEILPEVAAQAQQIASALELENTRFVVADFKTADVSDGSLIYCYSTCLRPESRKLVADLVAKTRPGTRILSVTHTLEHAELELREARELSWDGSTRSVYLHVRR
jgi:SAM-dependent methyltransferase